MTDLLLDQELWDTTVDIYGSIAETDGPYATAQSAANEVKLFAGEGWYDIAQGVPHFADILGVKANMGVIRQRVEAAALKVDDVRAARALLTLPTKDRTLQGALLITTEDGEEINVKL